MEEYRQISRWDLAAILRRRKYHILVPLLLLFAISVAIAYGLPPVYRSTGTILIEQQDIPADLVRTTVTSYAAERIQMITQRVLTYDSLWKMIEKYDLSPGEREKDPSTAVADLRSSITQEMISIDMIDPKSGRPAKAMIAFSVSVDHRDPQTAQRLAAEVVDLYLNENRRIRTEEAATTTMFLEQEGERLGKEMSELEAKLAAFKKENVTTLPDLMDLNMRQMDRTETELANVDKEIQTLQERAAYLESRLAQTEPMAPVYDDGGRKIPSPQERLRVLQAENARLAALYSPDHPDVTRVRRELAALQQALGGQPGATETVTSLTEQLMGARTELKAARERYSEEHPDVIRLKRTVANLEQAVKKAKSSSSGTVALPALVPDNPLYVSLQTELRTVNIGLQAAQARRAQLRERMADYEKRVVMTPQVEQEYLTLTRDYENAKKKYAEIRDKLLQARMAEQLEKESRGEKFSVIESPRVPDAPVKPNRLAILFLGLVISLGSSAGTAALAEQMDRTVRGPAMVTAALKMPPLAVIPYMRGEEAARKGKGLLLFALVVVLLAASAVVLLQPDGASPPGLWARMM